MSASTSGEMMHPERKDTGLIIMDTDGRPLGARALDKRRRILDATVMLLAEKPMRALRVVDVARLVGCAPTTFYQYFKDLEDVVVTLAGEAKESTPILVELVGGDWKGKEGIARGRQIAEHVLDHWHRNAPVLRARNNASDEGHAALREERMSAHRPLIHAFKGAIEEAQAKRRIRVNSEQEGEALSIDPLAGAVALTSCLERTAMHHAVIEEFGSTREEVVRTTAAILQAIVTYSNE